MKKFFLFLFLLGILFFGLIVTIFFVSLSISSQNTNEVTISIKNGDGLNEVSRQLKEAQLINSQIIFKSYIVIYNKKDKIQVGEYTFNKTTIPKIVSRITQPKNKRQEVVLVFKEGWTSYEMGEYLENQGLAFSENFTKLIQEKDWSDAEYPFLKKKPVNTDLEGYLFPDTYRIFIDGSADDVLTKMLDNFKVKVSTEMQTAFTEQNLTLHEAVTLASIVEKEARLKKDKKIVAGVFLNRLNIGKKLESDATVNYVTKKSTTRPTYSDITVDSLYNTYVYSGLPPGPICNPGLDALEAVAYPEKTDYMYFINTPTNSMIFSVTGEEHIANKNKYYPE